MRGRRYPDDLRAKAVALRERGYSLQEISDALHVPKNTLSGWLVHVRLTPAQRRRLQSKIIESGARGRPLAVLAWQRKIAVWKTEIQARVQHLASLPWTSSELAKLTCGLLYICEGGKYPATRCLSFGNSDPRMIQLFLSLFRRYFNVDEQKFRVSVLRRWDQDHAMLEKFWSEVTAIPLAQFYSSKADRRTKGYPTRQPNYHGVCRLQYLSTTLQYELQAIGEGVLNIQCSMPEKKLVEQEGLEPSASSMPSRRSVQTELLPHAGRHYSIASSTVSMNRRCG